MFTSVYGSLRCPAFFVEKHLVQAESFEDRIVSAVRQAVRNRAPSSNADARCGMENHMEGHWRRVLDNFSQIGDLFSDRVQKLGEVLKAHGLTIVTTAPGTLRRSNKTPNATATSRSFRIAA
jgi:hypothetical protein